ncbi:MAG TPA: hypothetical protein VF297_01935 [Pyrinomonadaceae bacterium]
MSSETASSYRFVSWVRQGLPVALTQTDSPTSRATINVRAEVLGRDGRPADSSSAVDVRAQLYGPGDVCGIDQRQVIRTDPAPRTTDFEPNFFPLVEFDRPDFPWMFTPFKANSYKQLRPWVCLVVVRGREGVTLSNVKGKPLSVLRINGGAYRELPDLKESWAWAHAQIAGTFKSPRELNAILEQTPERALSRLVCPRRLEPNTPYVACVVPTFEVGRLTGLGLKFGPEQDKTTLAWQLTTNAPESIELPVYYHWSFSTGESGSFESLARRLQPRVFDAGTREMDVSRPRADGLLPAAASGPLLLESALLSTGSRRDAWPDAQGATFQTELRKHLNKSDGTTHVLTAPVYGSVHANQPTVSDKPLWLRELNLDPRYRAAAGLGTAVVQREQEQLMAAAWEQAGDVKGVNRQLRQGQLARETGQSLLRRHFGGQTSNGSLLQLTRALHGHVGIRRRLADSATVGAAVSHVFRRLVRRNGPLGRRLFKESGQTPGTLLDELNRTAANGGLGLRQLLPRTGLPDGAMDIDWISKLSIPPEGVNYNYNSVRFRELEKYKDPVATAWQSAKSWTATQATWPVPPPTADGPAPPKLPADQTKADAMFTNFKAAAAAHIAYLNRSPAFPLAGQTAGQQRGEGDEFPVLEDMRQKILARLDPSKTILARVRKRLNVPDAIWTRSEPLDPYTSAPRFDYPMHRVLQRHSPESFLSGLERVPPNTVGLLVPNARFVEAFMVGLNHEMSRELLWRGFPTDLGATYFQSFWTKPRVAADGTTATHDLKPLADWGADQPLGANAESAAGRPLLVLLMRGDLMRRYPTAGIYAVKAAWAGAQLKRIIDENAEPRLPVFRCRVDSDTLLLGFELSAREAAGSTDPAVASPGWFFVFQEQAGEARFGLDAADDAFPGVMPDPLNGRWSDLAWNNLVTSADALRNLSHVKVNCRVNNYAVKSIKWSTTGNSGTMAFITRRPPARVAVHADALLPAP